MELKKEGVNIGHQLFCLSQELLQKRPKFRFLNFCYKFLLGIIFGGLCLKNAFDLEKATKIYLLSEKKENNFFGETKRCSAKMLVGKVVPRKITEELIFVNRTDLMSRTFYVEHFPMLSSKYYENNICFSIGSVN